MKNPFVASLAILLSLSSFAYSQRRSPSAPQTPSFNVTNQVGRVFDALARRDFAAICELNMDFSAGLAAIRKDSPVFLLTNKLESYRASVSKSFNWYEPIDRIAALRPTREIGDVRPRFIRYIRPGNLEGEDIPAFDVYVILRFTSWTNAPFMNGIGIRNPQFMGKVMKQLVARCVFEQSGLLQHMMLIDDGKETFPQLPFSIVGIDFNHQSYFDIYVVGGKGPFETETVIHGVKLEPLTEVLQGEVGVRLSLAEDFYQTRLQSKSRSRKGTLKVRDATGKEDSVSFIVPPFVPGDTTWFLLKHPWADNKHWKNTFLVDGQPPVTALDTE
jgi:hypothetical protein